MRLLGRTHWPAKRLTLAATLIEICYMSRCYLATCPVTEHVLALWYVTNWSATLIITITSRAGRSQP